MTPKSYGKCNANLWTNEKTLQLIKLYESCSDLWNASNLLYCNSKHKQELHAKLAAEIKIDVNEVTTKLNKLRCQYYGELRKSKVNEFYVPRWKFFKTLEFLSNADQLCDTTSNLEIDEVISSGYHNITSGTESDSEIISPSSPTSPNIVSPAHESYQNRKLDSKANLQNEGLMSNDMKHLSNPADSYQIFADYIADQLRSMTEIKRKRLKLMIQKAIITVEEEPEPIIIPSQVSPPLQYR